ncbi:helix-turn-helix domain-containing protein [Methyloversatilis sp.]|uniref:helix-turn-helix domain-containing protein n=1 Tax=Methyloversatilis sp. TaxID=2569862 RepID=UPI0035B02D97
MDVTLDLIECAYFLRVDKSTAQELASSGELPGAKIGRSWVFLRSDLESYLRREVQRQQAERKSSAKIDESFESAEVRAAEKKKAGRPRRLVPVLPQLSS